MSNMTEWIGQAAAAVSLARAFYPDTGRAAATGVVHTRRPTKRPDMLRRRPGRGGIVSRLVRGLALTAADIRAELARLSSVPNGAPLTAVCLGTPHFSAAEWRRLAAVLAGAAPCRTPIYVNTARETLLQLEAEPGFAALLAQGVVPVVDTCTYITPILREKGGAVMTNSGKWAHYAPSNPGVEVTFGNLEACVTSALAGRVVRDAEW